MGSQNVYIKNITGEYTSKSLKSMGVNYVLVGHFERKQYLHESNELINLKIKDAINNNIIPIVVAFLFFSSKEKLLFKI